MLDMDDNRCSLLQVAGLARDLVIELVEIEKPVYYCIVDLNPLRVALLKAPVADSLGGIL